MLLIANQQERAEQRRFSRKGIRSEKSQAVSELAILGTLILLGFGAILAYGQMMNSQQSLQMKAFRKALAKSRSENKVVSYTIVKDNPTIDVKDLFGRPDTNRQVVSSTVCAIKNDPLFPDPDSKGDRSSKEIYEINGRVRTIEPIKIKVEYDDGNDYETWMAAPISDVAYSTIKQRRGTLDKTESTSSISTTRSGSVTAQDTTNLILQGQDTFRSNYLADLQDEVSQEPWEKRIEIERLSRRLAFAFEFIVTGVLASSEGQSALIRAVMEALGMEISEWIDSIYNCEGGNSLVYSAILGGASLILSEVFGYFLNKGGTEGEAVSVSIEDGYRASDSLTGTASFSVPTQTFNVSP